MLNPYACYDVLSMAHHLRPSLGSVAAEESHLFAYTACLLFLYSGRPVSDWGYSFVAAPDGAPYSTALSDALASHLETGLLVGHGALHALSQRGEEERNLLSTLSELGKRDVYVEAASSSALALPVGVVRRAISQDPDILSASGLHSRRALLDGTALDVLYDHFNELRQALGGVTGDLLVPSIVWLSYLYRRTVDVANYSGEAGRDEA